MTSLKKRILVASTAAALLDHDVGHFSSLILVFAIARADAPLPLPVAGHGGTG